MPTHPCPLCGGYTARIPRRFIDRTFSLLMPIKRYKCQSYPCPWEGNVRVKTLDDRSCYNERYENT